MRLRNALARAAVSIALCTVGFASPVRAAIQIQEIAFACENGDSSVSFVELRASGASSVTNAIGLAAFNANGTLMWNVTGVFASIAGAAGVTVADGSRWLLATANFVTFTGCAADVALLRGPATGRGRLLLYRNSASGPVTLDQVLYGGGGAQPAPALPGHSLERVTGTSTFVDQASPSPTPANLTVCSTGLLPCSAPVREFPDAKLVISQVALQCVDGSTDGAFVELQAIRGDYHLAPGTALYGSDFIPLDTAALPGHVLRSGQHLLIAGPGFTARMGIAPDVLAALPVSEWRSGALRPMLRDSTGTSEIVYNPALYVTGLLPGFAWQRTDNLIPGTPLSLYELQPGHPSSSTAGPLTNSECFDIGQYSQRVHLSEVFLRCRLGDSLVQYVTLHRGPEAVVYYPAGTGLRAFDHQGALRFDLPHPFGAVQAGLGWPTDPLSAQEYVIAGPGFSSGPGDGADQVDPAFSLDPEGGRIELYVPGSPAERILDQLHYGPGGIPVPARGGTLARDTSGGWTERVIPASLKIPVVRLLGSTCFGSLPLGSALGGFPAFIENCQLFGPPQLNWPPVLGLGDASLIRAAARVGTDDDYYDLRLGTMHLASRTDASPSGSGGGGGWATDDYTVTGPPPGTLMSIDVRFTRTVADANPTSYCPPFPREGQEFCIECAGLVPGLAIGGQFVTKDFHAVTLDTTIFVRAGEAFTVSTFLSGWFIGGPGSHAYFDGQLHFDGLPVGATIRSVYGYTQDIPVAVELSLADARYADGVTHLRWHAGLERPKASVERQVDDGDWLPLADVIADGQGYYAYDDATPKPGTLVGYRLTWEANGARRSTAPVVLEIPGALVFALAGVRPNPTAGASQLAFTLDRAGEVTVSVHDVAGRRVLERRWVLEAGRYEMPLAKAGELRPGFYAVRLAHGGRTVTTRTIVRP